MSRPADRHPAERVLDVALGAAAATGAPVQSVAQAGVRTAAALWNGTVPRRARQPVESVVAAVEHRGVRGRARLAATADQALDALLTGSLAGAATRRLVAHRVPERVTGCLLEGETLERVLVIADERRAGIRAGDALLDRQAADRLVAYLLEHPALERLLARTLAGEEFERRLAALLDDPALERLVARTLESRFAHHVTTEILASDELRQVLDHVVRSDEVRAGLQSQSAGLATEVADEVRQRSMDADDTLERTARRLLRRRRVQAPTTEVSDRVLAGQVPSEPPS